MSEAQNIVQVERGRVWIKVGVRAFMLAYEPDNDEDAAWYAKQLSDALASFTPDVKKPLGAPIAPEHYAELAQLSVNAEALQAQYERGLKDGAQQAQAPGWQIVPVEPTPEMLKAGDKHTWALPSRDCWAAMLSAAPQQGAKP